MNWQAHIKEQVDHYARMAAIAGFKAHAWFQVNDMARKEPEFYGDMPYLLTVAMNERKAA